MITPVVLGFGGRRPLPDDHVHWKAMNLEAAAWYRRVVGVAPLVAVGRHEYITPTAPAGPNAYPPTHTQAIALVEDAFPGRGPFSIVGLGAGAAGAGSPQGCLIGALPFRAWCAEFSPRTQMWLLLHEWGHVLGLSHPYDVWNRSDTIMGYASTVRFEAGDDVGFTEQELATLRANPLMEKAPEASVALAIDCSNYSLPITHQQAAVLYSAGARRAVVQLVNERTLVHREQVPALLAAGIEVQFYVYVWFSAGEGFVAARVAWACREADAFPGVTKQMWLDCEQADSNDPPFDYVHLPVTPQIRAAVQAARDSGYAPGIYTAPWWWIPGASNSTEWSDLPLWHANYDGNPEIESVAYGGWGTPAMKQYAADQSLAGVPNINLNSYAQYEYPQPVPVPEPEPPLPPVFVPDTGRALTELDAAIERIHAAVGALTP